MTEPVRVGDALPGVLAEAAPGLRVVPGMPAPGEVA